MLFCRKVLDSYRNLRKYNDSASFRQKSIVFHTFSAFSAHLASLVAPSSPWEVPAGPGSSQLDLVAPSSPWSSQLALGASCSPWELLIQFLFKIDGNPLWSFLPPQFIFLIQFLFTTEGPLPCFGSTPRCEGIFIYVYIHK